MSNVLGFIATDIEMKMKIEEMYPKETKEGTFIIEVLEKDQVQHQGRHLELKGAKVIVGRSGSYDRSVGQVSVPLLRLRVSASDIMTALSEALTYKKPIALIIWNEIQFDRRWLKLLPEKVDIYTFSDGEDIEDAYNQACQTKDAVIVGGGVINSFARRDNRNHVFVNASTESIVETVSYGMEVLGYLNRSDYQKELLSKTMNSVSDAVIVIDLEGEVKLFNESAENVLKISMRRVLGKNLSKVLPELSFLEGEMNRRDEKKDELIRIGSHTITYNSSLLWEDEKVKGMLLAFEDITRLQTLEQKIRQKLNKKGLISKYTFDDFVHVAPSMKEMMKRAKIIGSSDSSAVIYGESGTGKELLAQSIHNVSNRKAAPFVAINCAALSESLLESELFGYEEGAFTGARKGGKPGMFELAHGGTIFLDEINSISLSLQSKLLRVIEEKEVMRLGSDYVLPLDVRVLSAANENLKEMVDEKTFRADLFYRLSSLEISIPSLRERKEDIKPLFDHFLSEIDQDKNIKWPSKESYERLNTYDWPGNVRELRNIVERYMLFGEIELPVTDEVAEFEAFDESLDLKEINQLIENRIISQLLKSGLSKTEIASKLGITRATLWNKIKKM